MSYHFPWRLLNPIWYGFELSLGKKAREERTTYLSCQTLSLLFLFSIFFEHFLMLLLVITKRMGNGYKIVFTVTVLAITLSIS